MELHPSVSKMMTILYLSKSDIIKLSGNSSHLYIEAVSHALTLHARGEIVQPLKPYLRWRGNEGHIADRIIAMPAYLGGKNSVAGLKWVGSKHDNPSCRGLERASALIILNDPETHYPVAVMEGSLISGMRTAAVTSVAARYLARTGFCQVACIGCGPIARMQLLTLLEQFLSITAIHLFDLKPLAAKRLVEELQRCFPKVEYQIAVTAKSAVQEGEVVITCTVTDKPSIPYEWLRKGTFLSNVSIMDVHIEKQVNFDLAGVMAGARKSIPIALSALAYGLVFGILSRQVGISLAESLLMSSLVFAGSAQFVVLDLWKTPLPVETIILTTLIVNLRHLLMSMSLSPWFSRLPPAATYGTLFFMSDESWALTMSEFARGGHNAAFLLGSGLTIFMAWLSATFVGQRVSSSLQDPSLWGLDFAFTAVFIALLVGLWKGKSDFLPWVVAAIIAVAAAQWLPGKWYILLGGMVGSFVGSVRHAD